ncbi:MAG: hypothetical protein MJZ17_05745 [Bacteroidales bacterium]|nr:hypothetical protein [Bacteroidales bacterium]
MEKQGVVKEGRTPSELSGKKSVMVKNGHALAHGEKDTISKAEQRLEQTMEPLYNNGG